MRTDGEYVMDSENRLAAIGLFFLLLGVLAIIAVTGFCIDRGGSRDAKRETQELKLC